MLCVEMPTQRERAADPARLFDRQVFLADVHAACAHHRRDVGAVVDDDPHTARRQVRDQFQRLVMDFSRRGAFVAQLDQFDARICQLERKLDRRVRCKGSDRGSRRALETNLLPSYFPVVAVSRSRKCVSNFPAWKSGSARMRL